MTELFDRRMADLQRSESARASLHELKRGIERESLRVDPSGYLAQTPHPAPLGSKLCHPYITTDFSEAQPEFITPVANSPEGALDFLEEILRFAHLSLGDETLWSASMPCMLAGDGRIPLAQYGMSNLGRLKTTYREGLSRRYGRLMQTICAVHYNFSLPDSFWQEHHALEGEGAKLQSFRSARYFDLMRNFRRYSWLPIYLFGASPAVCNSFVQGREHRLSPFGRGSLHAPFGTSLRNGNLGYESSLQANAVRVSYNHLDSYVADLAAAITTPYAPYTQLGVRTPGGYLQVSDCFLQSEAEFYTTIRAKCVPPSGVNFLKELGERGVEYIEVRLLDVNPFLALGIDAEQIRFLDTFLVFCLLEESPLLLDADETAIRENVSNTVTRGRDPQLLLRRNAGEVSLAEWGEQLFSRMQPVAELLDANDPAMGHQQALRAQHARIVDPAATISARILACMTEEQIPYFRFAMNKSAEHQSWFRSTPLAPERIRELQRVAVQSEEDQRSLEARQAIDFETYLERFHSGYFALLDRSVAVAAP